MKFTQFLSHSTEGQSQVHTFIFYRDNDGSWYIDFPEYIEHGYGSKANLRMVAGADNLLENLAPNGLVTATFSNHPVETYDIHLSRILKDPWGATYTLHNFSFKTVWLCNVSKFIFKGHHPKHIYIQIHKNK